MATTYEPIATTTLGSAAATVDFSSIPGTYTDLVLVCNVNKTTVDTNILIQFNSDTGSNTNYSTTILTGDGSAASSNRYTNSAAIYGSKNALINTVQPSLHIFNIFSYTGSTNKTVLTQSSGDRNGSGGVDRTVGLWRNTAAITAVRVKLDASATDKFNIGSTFTLYGIKSA